MPINRAAYVCISVCLGILGGLLKVGFKPEDVAYIKPATQCESAQVILLCIAKPEKKSRGANVPKSFRAHRSRIGMVLTSVHGMPQLVTKWCDAKGIANRGLGPVIFYKGFTREFLKGNVSPAPRDSQGHVDVSGLTRYLLLLLRLHREAS